MFLGLFLVIWAGYCAEDNKYNYLMQYSKDDCTGDLLQVILEEKTCTAAKCSGGWKTECTKPTGIDTMVCATHYPQQDCEGTASGKTYFYGAKCVDIGSASNKLFCSGSMYKYELCKSSTGCPVTCQQYSGKGGSDLTTLCVSIPNEYSLKPKSCSAADCLPGGGGGGGDGEKTSSSGKIVLVALTIVFISIFVL